MLSEALSRLEKAMDNLSEDSRELIVAVKIEGRTYDEIAQALGKSPDAVRRIGIPMAWSNRIPGSASYRGPGSGRQEVL
jgi:hypothetical protein